MINFEEVTDVAKWAIVALAIVAIAWAPVSCVKDGNAKVQIAIEQGVDPIRARCAYAASGTSSPACIVAAAKEVK